MRFALVLALLVCIAGLVLAFQNPGAARVSFLAWQFESSLALVLLIAFGAGILAGMLLMLPGRIRAGLTASSRRRELDEVSRKLTECEARLARAEAAVTSLSAPKPDETAKSAPTN